MLGVSSLRWLPLHECLLPLAVWGHKVVHGELLTLLIAQHLQANRQDMVEAS